jgi:K+:H+ antiporter
MPGHTQTIRAAAPAAPGPVPPVAAHHVLILLLQLGTLLLAATALGRLAQRLGLPAVTGELTAGVVLGPSVLGHGWAGPVAWIFPAHPDQAHLLDAVSQLGVILLAGVAGLHMDVRMVLRRSRAVASVSLGGLVVPLALGVAAGYAVPAGLSGGGDRATFAVFLGVSMCVSAVPVIAKMLTDMNLLHRDAGQLTLAAATIEDALAWFLLSVVSAMAAHALGAGAGMSLLGAAGFLAAAVLAGRPMVHTLLRLAARAAEHGPLNATAAAIILLCAAAASALGLEAVFGALLAGIFIGSCPATDPARLSPLRTVVLAVLAPIFLASAGLRVDVAAVARPAVAVAGAVILLLAVVGKFAGAYAGARLGGLSHWEGMALGAGLNARGVVEIVIATVGLQLGVINVAMYTIIVLVAVLTSAMTPPMLRRAMSHIGRNAAEHRREAELMAWAGPPRAPSGAGR